MNQKQITIGILAAAAIGLLLWNSQSEENSVTKQQMSAAVQEKNYHDLDSNLSLDQNKTASAFKKKSKIHTGEFVLGYELPPEPDPDINNATLLGVDVNHNRVRDDVERVILLDDVSYPDALTKAAGLGEARLSTEILDRSRGGNFGNIADYVQSIDVVIDYAERRSGNNHYIRSVGPTSDRARRKKYEGLYYNTSDRKLAYAKFNGSLSGSVIHMPISDNDFAYRYQDFTLNGKEDLSEYEWKRDYYQDKPIPVYSEEGDIIGLLHKSDYHFYTNKEVCQVNYGTENLDECLNSFHKKKDLFLKYKYNVDKMRREGAIND